MLQYYVPSNPETPFGANITAYIGEIEENLDVSLLDNIQIGVGREFLNDYLDDFTQFEPQEIAVAVQMPTAVSIGIKSYSIRFNIQ